VEHVELALNISEDDVTATWERPATVAGRRYPLTEKFGNLRLRWLGTECNSIK
jgi:hypothetical protein